MVLDSNYLLDNRGIGKNVASLKWTYEEYAALKNASTLTELCEHIVDKEPLKALCDCGKKSAFPDIEKTINQRIDQSKLRTTCKGVK